MKKKISASIALCLSLSCQAAMPDSAKQSSAKAQSMLRASVTKDAVDQIVKDITVGSRVDPERLEKEVEAIRKDKWVKVPRWLCNFWEIKHEVYDSVRDVQTGAVTSSDQRAITSTVFGTAVTKEGIPYQMYQQPNFGKLATNDGYTLELYWCEDPHIAGRGQEFIEEGLSGVNIFTDQNYVVRRVERDYGTQTYRPTGSNEVVMIIDNDISDLDGKPIRKEKSHMNMVSHGEYMLFKCPGVVTLLGPEVSESFKRYMHGEGNSR